AAIRLRVPELEYRFVDRVQGEVRQHLGREVGDFVIQRRDGFYAYQLAVVLDDAWQGITDIVRGADLLDSTPRQLYLQE
ncbi:glutamate--tRNA ligase family protein, partial [Pseudomonas aeruginosa]